MTDINFENKHPRGEAGKFAAKEGEAANVTLAAPEHEPVHARVIHQVWQGDYAVETGETSDFDARPVLDSMTLEEIESTTSYGGLYEIHESAVSVGRATEPDGPSYVEIPGLDDYVEWREENGLTEEIAPLTPSASKVDETVKGALNDVRSTFSLRILTGAENTKGFRNVIGTDMKNAVATYDGLDEYTKANMRFEDRAQFEGFREFVNTRTTEIPGDGRTYAPEAQKEATKLVASFVDYHYNRPDERPTE